MIFLSIFFSDGVTLINGDIFIRRHAISSIQSVDLQIYIQIQINIQIKIYI